MKKLTLCSILIALVLFCGCKPQRPKFNSWQKEETSGKWGYVSPEGEALLPYMYDSMHPVGWYPLAAVCLDGKWGLVNVEKKAEITPCTYDFTDDVVRTKTLMVNIGGERVDGKVIGGKWGLLNEEGKEILPCLYDYINVGVKGITVKAGDERGELNYSGEFTSPLTKYVYTHYAGESKHGNETRTVSFDLETINDTGRVIRNFSFEVEKNLGAGEGAMERTQTFSVKTSQGLAVPANGVYKDEKINVALKSDSADCSIINEEQTYTCTALKQ